MIELLTLVWAVSATVAWEIQVTCLHGSQRRWDAITIGSLMPVYNTLLAWCYIKDKFKERGST